VVTRGVRARRADDAWDAMRSVCGCAHTGPPEGVDVGWNDGLGSFDEDDATDETRGFWREIRRKKRE
jgi:hypothetical protein